MNKIYNTILSVALMLALMPTLIGVQIIHHVCNSHQVEHIDVELLAGISDIKICTDTDECCNHHQHNNCAKDDCRDDSKILSLGDNYVPTTSARICEPMQLQLLFIEAPTAPLFKSEPTTLPLQTFANDVKFTPLQQGQWQSFSCIYIC